MFAELLNRLHIGKHTEDDLKLQNTHIIRSDETAHPLLSTKKNGN